VPRPDRETPDISIAYCPERVLPGKILEELTNNDRSIGGITPRCARKALAFYKRFVRGTCVTTDARSAEMTKLVENAYRDVNIAFANELSIVADRMGLDVWEVIRLANRHPRVNILHPGPGVGGHCIAVDPWFIVHGAPEETPLIRTARGVNDGKIHHVIARAEALVEAHPRRKSPASASPSRPTSTISAKARPAPSPPRWPASSARGSRWSNPMPPNCRIEFDRHRRELIDIDTALEDCGVLIVLVDHDVFRAVPLAERAGKLVYDTRGIWPISPCKPRRGLPRWGDEIASAPARPGAHRLRHHLRHPAGRVLAGALQPLRQGLCRAAGQR
jgi:UDP-N-acetyl-D-mannosaminuronic acid dehydrogenase